MKENGPAGKWWALRCWTTTTISAPSSHGGPGEAVFIDSEEEEVGRVSKLVYSYVKEVNNCYILAKKGALKVGDRIKIHGHDCVITEKNWLN